MKNVTIYTDGSCSGNPGPGGYAAVILQPEGLFELSGHIAHTTNNRAELLAVVEGLNAVPSESTIRLFSDSQYVVNALNKGWVRKWRNRGWRKTTDEGVQNVDLWLKLLEAIGRHKLVKFSHVRGHAGDVYNTHADDLARGAVRGDARPLRPCTLGSHRRIGRDSNFTSVRF